MAQEYTYKDLWRYATGDGGAQLGFGSAAATKLVLPSDVVTTDVAAYPILDQFELELGSNTVAYIQHQQTGKAAENWLYFDKAIKLHGFGMFRMKLRTEYTFNDASTASPVEITLDQAHGYGAGSTFLVEIAGNTGTPSLNGRHVATRTNTTKFTIVIDNTGGTATTDGTVSIQEYAPEFHAASLALEAQLQVIGDHAGTTGITRAQGRLGRDVHMQPKLDVMLDGKRRFSMGSSLTVDEDTGYVILHRMQKGDNVVLDAIQVANGTTTEAHLEAIPIRSTPVKITAISAANPAVLTFSEAHGFSSGETFLVDIEGHTGAVNINGTHEATWASATTASIPVTGVGATSQTAWAQVEDSTGTTTTIASSTGTVAKGYTFQTEIPLTASKQPFFIALRNLKDDAGDGIAYGYVQGYITDMHEADRFWHFVEVTASNAIEYATLKEITSAIGSVVVERIGVCGNGAVQNGVGYATAAAGTNYLPTITSKTEDIPGAKGAWLFDQVDPGSDFVLLKLDDTGGTGASAAAMISGYLVNER